MSNLISKHLALNCKPEFLSENLGKDYCYNLGWNNAITEQYKAIREIKTENIPSVDRPQGEWIEMGQNENGTHNVKCNQCHYGYKMRGHAKSIDTERKYRFCPHCGARMKGANDEMR